MSTGFSASLAQSLRVPSDTRYTGTSSFQGIDFSIIVSRLIDFSVVVSRLVDFSVVASRLVDFSVIVSRLIDLVS